MPCQILEIVETKLQFAQHEHLEHPIVPQHHPLRREVPGTPALSNDWNKANSQTKKDDAETWCLCSAKTKKACDA